MFTGRWKRSITSGIGPWTRTDTIRTKNAALNWAIVRDTTISALRLAGHTNIAKARRETARDPGLVLQIIAQTSRNRL